MLLFKCKMCGGNLQLNENVSVGECSYCGTRQTLPRLDDDKRANLYDRANHFRRNGEFDKAAAIYDDILNEDRTDAEAYWSLVLCKYGIEYVEDPKTHKRIPTCNRTQYTSIFADDDYKQALAYADPSAKAVYEAEAKVIDEIQKGILAISASEEPFDVFICYKESDQNGRRTPDSVLAQDLYFQLKQEGFKVFFSRITLEDELGTAYEPYIFAALNSSKVMVVIGTKPENFNSPWVKNEWCRYLVLIKNGAKKILIPAYKDMNPYDLPEEFSHLQAQDMSKLGFMQDLIRGTKKIISDCEPKTAAKETTIIQNNANTASLLERAFLCLEDGEWVKADQLLEQVLNLDPKNAKAYIGKLMAELNIREESYLTQYSKPIADYNNFQKAVRFSDEKCKAVLNDYNQTIIERIENDRKQAIYNNAMDGKNSSQTENDYIAFAEAFKTIIGYKDAEEQSVDCMRLAEANRVNAENERMQRKKEAENEQLERNRQRELCLIATKKRKKKIFKILKIAVPSTVVLFAFLILLNTLIIPEGKYSKALDLIDGEKYAEAALILRDLSDYKDSKERLEPFRIFVLSVGDIIEFGVYEQDNNNANGKETIVWRVLAVENNKVLLISEKCLNCVNYNDKNESVTWETCTVRGWLNEDFLNSAFTEEEKNKIPTTVVENPHNTEYNTDGGNATSDRIFLLSIDEAKEYFASNLARQAKPTPYAVEQGAYEGTGGNAWWWLRSPGIDQFSAADVYDDGYVSGRGDIVCNDSYINNYGNSVDHYNFAVRPALWVNLQS